MNFQPRNPNSLPSSNETEAENCRISPPGDDNGRRSYDDLRELIVGKERRRIEEIQRRLDDPVQRAEEISRALPDAMLLGATRDGRIAEALQPAMDSAIKSSVQKNPKALVDAIYPILGPGIRKAVSSILMGMIQSLNRVLDTAFSLRGLKWRLEAIRSHRPFAEVVLLHTLEYQVEQIFLVHRGTGLVLQHVSSPDIITKDPDLVSGMLSAIQDFVNDSFATEEYTALETLRMGEGLSVIVEQSRHAILAAVIRGTPPVELREKFRGILLEIQQKFEASLEAFQGDTDPFIILKNRLEEGLEQRLRTEAGKISPLVWFVCIVGLVALGYLVYQPIHDAHMWKGFIQDLRRQSGIIITDYGKGDGGHYVSGLRDSLGVDTDDIQTAYPFQNRELDLRLAPYDSLEPAFVLQRAEKLLAPPGTVQLSFSENCLTASGVASNGWIQLFTSRAVSLSGVESIDTSALTNNDVAAFENAVQELLKISIIFPKGSYTPLAGQEDELALASELIGEIQALSDMLGINVQIILFGRTDPTGTGEYNRRLSRDRADAILARLMAHGTLPTWLSTIGITSEMSAMRQDASMGEIETERSVTFSVYHTTLNPEPEKP